MMLMRLRKKLSLQLTNSSLFRELEKWPVEFQTSENNWAACMPVKDNFFVLVNEHERRLIVAGGISLPAQ
jgi:hypothetical protein